MTIAIARDHLRSFVERIERLEEEKKVIADDIKNVYAEAKGNGFDTKALRAVVRLRKQDPGELAEHEAILGTYLVALGMVDGAGDVSAAGREHLDKMAKKQTRRAAHSEA
jgi:uncharacterized protein (UPF0335 family)